MTRTEVLHTFDHGGDQYRVTLTDDGFDHAITILLEECRNGAWAPVRDELERLWGRRIDAEAVPGYPFDAVLPGLLAAAVQYVQTRADVERGRRHLDAVATRAEVAVREDVLESIREVVARAQEAEDVVPVDTDGTPLPRNYRWPDDDAWGM